MGFWSFLDKHVVHTRVGTLLPRRLRFYLCDRWDAQLLGMSLAEMRRFKTLEDRIKS